jgi:hypothetical protein
MTVEDIIQRIEIIDKKIQFVATGSPSTLAKSLRISDSQLYNTLKIMKRLGAPIKFSKELQSYYYTSKKRFIIGFVDPESLSWFLQTPFTL